MNGSTTHSRAELPIRRRGGWSPNPDYGVQLRQPFRRMHMNRRQIGHSAALTWILAMILTLLPRSPAVAQQVIGVNAFPNAKALPLHAGIAKGIFVRRGLRLELELTEGATAQRRNFAAGKFQIVHSAIDNAVYNIEVAKLDNVILSGGDQGMNEFYVQGSIK